MLLRVVLSCPAGALALAPPRRCWPRSTTARVLPGATRHEVRSHLQKPAPCAGLPGAQAKGQGRLLPVPGLGLFHERYRAPRPDATCLRDSKTVRSMSRDRLLVRKSHQKQLGAGPRLGGVGLRESPGPGEQVQGDPQRAHTCACGGRAGPAKGQGSTPTWEKAARQLTLMGTLRSLPCAPLPLRLLPPGWSSEAVTQ